MTCNKSRHCCNGIACAQATPRAALGFCSANRAENLCYQLGHGQKLPPQFRKIVGLVYSIWWDTHTRFEIIGKFKFLRVILSLSKDLVETKRHYIHVILHHSATARLPRLRSQ